MARIKIVTLESARGIRKFLLNMFKKKYGGTLPGIFKIAMVDLKLGFRLGQIYQHLHLRKTSPLSRLQREMMATVVNGLVGGAP